MKNDTFADSITLNNTHDELNEFGGFEADQIPESITIESPHASMLMALSGFLLVTSSKEDAAMLDSAEMSAIAREFSTFPLFLSSTGRPAPTIERLGRDAKATVFITSSETSEKDLSAVSDTVAALRAVGVAARSYAVPDAHASIGAWLLSAGAERVRSALHAAGARAAFSDEEKPLEGGYVPLGYASTYYVWSNAHEEVQELTRANFGNPGTLISAAGEPWLQDKFPKKNEKGKIVGIDFIKAAGALRDGCARLKNWDSKRIKLAGVWKDGDAYVVNSSECFYAEDGAPVKRTGNKIYAKSHDLGITPDTPQATADEILEVLNFLSTFNFSRRQRVKKGKIVGRDTDALLVLGTLFIMYLCASLSQRPHCFVHADAGTGKSSLLRFFTQMLGDACVSTSKSSGAGLMTNAKDMKACIATIADESGYDSRHSESVAEFLNLGYNGATKKMGSKDQSAVSYEIRTLALLAGTIPPAMDAQLSSRVMLLKMHAWPENEPRIVHDFFTPEGAENPAVEALGLRMFSRALKSGPRYERAVSALKKIVGVEGRVAETLVPAIAGAYCALNDGELLDDEAQQWLDMFDVEEDIERLSTTNIGDEVMQYILSTTVDTSASGSRVSMSIAELCVRAALDSDRGPWRQNLGVNGLRVDQIGAINHSIGIATKSQGFKNLMKSSKWAKSDLEILVKRIPGCSEKKQKGSFASVSETFNTVPWSAPRDDNGMLIQPPELRIN